ncbi:hypothetical protein Tco_1026490, partial [Tanacetum coccineum]
MQYIVKCLGGVQGSHDQLNLNQQTITYSLCWGLNIDIAGILFFDLIAQLHPQIGKHEKKPNICYTRYLSLVMEHMMKENYKNYKLLSLKPYKITSVTLRTPLENETLLTAHMCNKAKKKTIPSSTRPEALNLSRIETSSSSQGTHLQPAEELVVFADETKSLDVSESAGAQENQNETAKAKKVLNTSVKENMEEKDKDEDHSSDVEQLLDEVDKKKLAIQHAQESPFDTKSEILFVKSFQASQIAKYAEVTLMRSGPMDMDAQTVDSEFKLKSMPDDDLQSLSGLKTSVSDSSHDVSHSEHTSWEKTASAKFQCLSGYLDHVCEESSMPDLICHSLKAQLPGLLSDALKNYLPQLLKESLTPLIPYVFESVTKEQAQLNKWEVRSTLEVAVIVDDHAEGEKSKEGQMDKNANHVTTQGEHSNVVKNDTISDASHGEHNFSPAPLKEPSPPRDPAKGKGVDMEEPVNILVPFMDEGGSNPKMPSLKPFINIEVVSTQEEIIEQLAEIKRLADLRAQEEESKKALKKLLNPAAVKAQMLKWKEHEEKKAKLVNEYYLCIQRRTNPLPITKISYIINSQKEPTMRITKGNDPLNLTVYPNFRLRMLGFSEWLEVHALASKMSSKSIDSLLQSLRSKFQWVLNQAKNLGLPPPPALASFGMTVEDKKRKRMETLKEVFVKERIDVVGTQRNITPPSGVVGKEVFQRETEFHITNTVQLIKLLNYINLDSPEAREMYKIIEIEIESRDDVDKAREIVMKRLSECKASESNIRRIRVKDIIKEVEDYLKTYSSAGMDIR